MPWREGTRVGAAVLRFAANGQGDVERIANDPLGLWLHASNHVVRLRLRPDDQTIFVLYLIRSSR